MVGGFGLVYGESGVGLVDLVLPCLGDLVALPVCKLWLRLFGFEMVCCWVGFEFVDLCVCVGLALGWVCWFSVLGAGLWFRVV